MLGIRVPARAHDRFTTMAQTAGASSRLAKGVAVLLSRIGVAFGFVSPSDATLD